MCEAGKMCSAETSCDDFYYIDNGATKHITMSKDKFVDFKYFTKSYGVKTAHGKR